MQRQTVVAEASLPSGKQGDRGPERPDASNEHTDVRATSPRKDPQSQFQRDAFNQQLRENLAGEPDAIIQRQSTTTLAMQDTVGLSKSGDNLLREKLPETIVQSIEHECVLERHKEVEIQPVSDRSRESADAS